MKLFRSFVFATAGIIACCKKESNFKIHLSFAALAVFFGIILHISSLEWVAILFCMALVLSLEMLNTAIERICNFINPDVNPAIKIIKDIAAGAVLVAAFVSFIIGGIIFLPKFFTLLKSILYA